MKVELEISELKNLLIAAAEIGANKALIECGEIKPSLTKKEAYDRYGRGVVDRWIMEGLITPYKDGSKSAKVRLDRARLEVLRVSSNRATYLTTDERMKKIS